MKRHITQERTPYGTVFTEKFGDFEASTWQWIKARSRRHADRIGFDLSWFDRNGGPGQPYTRAYWCEDSKRLCYYTAYNN